MGPTPEPRWQQLGVHMQLCRYLLQSDKHNCSLLKTACKPTYKPLASQHAHDMPADVTKLSPCPPTPRLPPSQFAPTICRGRQAGGAVHSVCGHAVSAAFSAAGSHTAGSAHPAHVRDGQGTHSNVLQRCPQRGVPKRPQAGSLPCCLHLADLQGIQHTAGVCVHSGLCCVLHPASGTGLDGGHSCCSAAACAGMTLRPKMA